MRIANLYDRASVLTASGAVDIAELSGGEFDSSVDAIYRRWDDFTTWATTVTWNSAPARGYRSTELGAPVTMPRQIIALGLNYREHASETGFETPHSLPPVFTKFVSSITGPDTTVSLPEGNVDWEVELAVVIGRTASRISPADAWNHIAGVTVAQDLSERVLQMSGPAPQFSLGKSHAGFLPLGPAVVTLDDIPDRDSIRLTARVNEETVQDGNTREMIVPIAESISRLSNIVTLLPGDLILTGTPAGVGMGRHPQRYLAPGDVLTSSIEGIGTIRQRFVQTAR